MRKLRAAQEQMMKKMVRDDFSKDKTFWNIGMFVHPKTMLIHILYFSPNAR